MEERVRRGRESAHPLTLQCRRAGCCALIEPDPENWTVERVMAILICMFIIEPFVIAMEWVMLNVVNAPVARRRDPRALAFARAQQRFVWESLAREREVDSEAECEADAGTPRLGFAALVPPAVAAKRARHGVRTVRCPGGPPARQPPLVAHEPRGGRDDNAAPVAQGLG